MLRLDGPAAISARAEPGAVRAGADCLAADFTAEAQASAEAEAFTVAAEAFTVEAEAFMAVGEAFTAAGEAVGAAEDAPEGPPLDPVSWRSIVRRLPRLRY